MRQPLALHRPASIVRVPAPKLQPRRPPPPLTGHSLHLLTWQTQPPSGSPLPLILLALLPGQPPPPSSHPTPATSAQATFPLNGYAHPSSQVNPPGSGPPLPPGPQSPAMLGSEHWPSLQEVAALEAAQPAHLHLPRPTANSRGTPSSGFIRALRPGASAARVQPLGVPNAYTALEMAPTASLSHAPTGLELAPGGLIMEPSLKGGWACPDTGSPAAHMDLTLPCLIDSAESKHCSICQS